MKNIIIVSILALNVSLCFAQAKVKDTIFIEFNQKLDTKKVIQTKVYFNIQNPLYDEELKEYNQELKSLKNDEGIKYLNLPQVNYNFFTEDTLANTRKSNVGFQFYDRKGLIKLKPYNTFVFIVEKTDCLDKLYPVFFYRNEME